MKKQGYYTSFASSIQPSRLSLKRFRNRCEIHQTETTATAAITSKNDPKSIHLP